MLTFFLFHLLLRYIKQSNKMKFKLLPFIFLLLISFSAISQIENEIRSYVDSTEMLINNGRKYLIEQIKNENFQKTKEIYNYLNDATLEKSYDPFYYSEHLYINTFLKDWNSLLKYAANYNSLNSNTIPRNAPDIYSDLYQKTKENIEEYQKDIEFNNLTNKEKLVIELLLKLVENGAPDVTYNALLKEYKSLNDNNELYDSFVRQYLPNKQIKASITYSFGSGMMFPTQKLDAGFNTTPLAEMAMDFNIGNVYSSLYFLGGGFSFQDEVKTRLNYDLITFQEGDHLIYFEGGLKAGYFVHRGDRFQFAPFVILAGATLESNFYEEESNDDEFTILNTFCYGAGFHTELKISEYQFESYYGTQESSYFSLKLDCSYKQFAKFDQVHYKGALPTVNLAIVWGFGIF